MQNAKNQLQEFYQKKRLPVPKYISQRCGGNDHQPLWTSTVILHDGNHFQGDVCVNKSLSDISAAELALIHLKSNNPKHITPTNQLSSFTQITSNTPIISSFPKITSTAPDINSINPILPITSPDINLNRSVPTIISNLDPTIPEEKTAILVDVENLPKFIDSIIDKLHNYTVFAFIGQHHCLSDKEYPPGVIKITSPSTRSDGTDTAIQVYTGVLLSQQSFDCYLIATRDHFGSSLVEMISSPGLGWTPKKSRLVTNPSQL